MLGVIILSILGRTQAANKMKCCEYGTWFWVTTEANHIKFTYAGCHYSECPGTNFIKQQSKFLNTFKVISSRCSLSRVEIKLRLSPSSTKGLQIPDALHLKIKNIFLQFLANYCNCCCNIFAIICKILAIICNIFAKYLQLFAIFLQLLAIFL